MTETLIACPRCDAPLEEDWSYCPKCAMALDTAPFDPSAFSDRIQFIRRESETRSRRNRILVSLASVVWVLAALLVVGGGVVLFHPSFVQTIFQYQDTASFGRPPEMDAAPGSPEFEWATTEPKEWVRIPEGPFRWGPTKRTEKYSLREFEIHKYEVTNFQWWSYLHEEQDRLKSHTRFKSAVPKNWGWDPDSGEFPDPSELLSEIWEKPVTLISWRDAQDFCVEWLSTKPNSAGARLPFSYEWVKAARGPKDDRPYPWGFEFFDLRKGLKIPRANIRETGVFRPTDVGGFARSDVSPYGVVGMGGNVSEYVNFAQFMHDWPQPGYMGASYMDYEEEANLFEDFRADRGSDHRWKYVGFRPARFVDPPEGEEEDK